MNGSRLLWKEVRAALPIFAATMATMACGAMAAHARGYGGRFGVPLFVLSFAFGCAGVPAHAWGHEYTYHTLGALMAQPVSRRRVMVAKAAVSVPLVLALVLTARFVFLTQPSDRAPETSLFVAAAIFGIAVAPLMTMLGRSVLAGTVLTIAAAGALLVGADIAAAARYDFAPVAEVDALKWRIVTWGALASCSAAGLFGWRLFMRLQALDGPGQDVQLPRLGARLMEPSRARPRTGLRASALVQQLWKEVRLQQMAFVVCVLFLGMWCSVVLVQHYFPRTTGFPVAALSLLYFGLLSTIVGALACAEERQLGTWPAQQLLPRPRWQLTLVKVAVALGVALLLGLAVPAVLWLVRPDALVPPRTPSFWAQAAAVMCLITLASTYVSSFITTSMRAIVVAVPSIWAAAVYLDWTEWFSFNWLWRHTHLQTLAYSRIYYSQGYYGRLVTLVVLLLVFTYRNTSAEPRAAKVASQIAILLLAAFALTFVTLGLGFAAIGR